MKGELSKLGDVPYYYLGSLVLIYRSDTSFHTLTAAATQVTDEILHGGSYVFGHDIHGAQFGRIMFLDVGQNLASVTQRLATNRF
jgi:hypothetical protein